MKLHPLVKINLILLLFFLVFAGLYFARSFLVPISFGAIFAMVMIPLSKRLENLGLHRALSALVCLLLLVAIFSGLIALLSSQVASFSKDMAVIETQVNRQLDEAQRFIEQKVGISYESQEKMIKEQTSGDNSPSTLVAGLIGSLTKVIMNGFLVIIYLFLFIYYRTRLKKFVLKLVRGENKERVHDVISRSSQVAQHYLLGRGILMIVLTVFYLVGLSVVGVRNALFFSVLAALLSIVPWVGNLFGMILPMLMVFVQGGDIRIILGVMLVFGITQLIDTYIFEPLVLGYQVNIHPLFIIIIAVLGEIVWGIPGLILSIPVLGMVKIVFDNVDALEPYAYLLGAPRQSRRESAVVRKIKSWFR
ncbi:putative PurR-regulated permease PerM [Anseongella ginsenosidimutans]|uniref:Putative PurR-regulated permease PerM n=1 Tax=Anseongella ginsenosidimutans TaxID=496056 RepID=A0A4R3KQX4_9SPHI|nr:AI-2E family transporter [Anseongella ginsenosidimutans]TCS87300.1 putative PurR-regulated permease PerM [Anseongella ginsenosidimutans]